MYTEGKHVQEARNVTAHREATQDSLQESQKQAQAVQRMQESPVPRCANCDIDILWTPVVVRETIYCCAGCAAGGPCSCDYSQYRSVNIDGVIHYGIGSQS